MRVQIEKARNECFSLGIDDTGARREGQVGADSLNELAVEENGPAKGLGAATVHDHGVDNGGTVAGGGAREGEGEGGDPDGDGRGCKPSAGPGWGVKQGQSLSSHGAAERRIGSEGRGARHERGLPSAPLFLLLAFCFYCLYCERDFPHFLSRTRKEGPGGVCEVGCPAARPAASRYSSMPICANRYRKALRVTPSRRAAWLLLSLLRRRASRINSCSY